MICLDVSFRYRAVCSSIKMKVLLEFRELIESQML